MSLRDAWEDHSTDWITWARTPGHDSYWRFHRDAFLPLLPPPGRLTLDLGCGEGRVGRDLVALGHRVVELDVSPTMADAAATHPDAAAPVAVADIAKLGIKGGCADLAVAFMSIHDVDAMEPSIAEAARVLGPGGRLAIAIVHPLNSAGGFEGERDDPDRPFVITGSWFERRRTKDLCTRDGLSMTFESEHRPLQDYVDAVADNGFLVERIREVRDPDDGGGWQRVPMFLHLLAVKPATPS